MDNSRYENTRYGHRYRVLPIPYNALLNIFVPPSEVNIIQRIKLPMDAHVVSVHHKPETHEWLVFLESEEFSIIEEGMEVPRIEFNNEFVTRYNIKEE